MALNNSFQQGTPYWQDANGRIYQMQNGQAVQVGGPVSVQDQGGNTWLVNPGTGQARVIESNQVGVPVGTTQTYQPQPQQPTPQPTGRQVPVLIRGPGYELQTSGVLPENPSPQDYLRLGGVASARTRVPWDVTGVTGISRDAEGRVVVQKGVPEQNEFWASRGLFEYANFPVPKLTPEQEAAGDYILGVGRGYPGQGPDVVVRNKVNEEYWNTLQGGKYKQYGAEGYGKLELPEGYSAEDIIGVTKTDAGLQAQYFKGGETAYVEQQKQVAASKEFWGTFQGGKYADYAEKGYGALTGAPEDFSLEDFVGISLVEDKPVATFQRNEQTQGSPTNIVTLNGVDFDVSTEQGALDYEMYANQIRKDTSLNQFSDLADYNAVMESRQRLQQTQLEKQIAQVNLTLVDPSSTFSNKAMAVLGAPITVEEKAVVFGQMGTFTDSNYKIAAINRQLQDPNVAAIVKLSTIASAPESLIGGAQKQQLYADIGSQIKQASILRQQAALSQSTANQLAGSQEFYSQWATKLGNPAIAAYGGKYPVMDLSNVPQGYYVSGFEEVTVASGPVGMGAQSKALRPVLAATSLEWAQQQKTFLERQGTTAAFQGTMAQQPTFEQIVGGEAAIKSQLSPEVQAQYKEWMSSRIVTPVKNLGLMFGVAVTAPFLGPVGVVKYASLGVTVSQVIKSGSTILSGGDIFSSGLTGQELYESATGGIIFAGVGSKVFSGIQASPKYAPIVQGVGSGATKIATSFVGRTGINAVIGAGGSFVLSGGNAQAALEGAEFGALFSIGGEVYTKLASYIPAIKVGTYKAPLEDPILLTSNLEAEEFSTLFGTKRTPIMLTEGVDNASFSSTHNIIEIPKYGSPESNAMIYSNRDIDISLQHELGHATQFELSSTLEGIEKLTKIGVKPYFESTIQERELAAWKIAGIKINSVNGAVPEYFDNALLESLHTYGVNDPLNSFKLMAQESQLLTFNQEKFSTFKAFYHSAPVATPLEISWRGLYLEYGNKAIPLIGKSSSVPEGLKFESHGVSGEKIGYVPQTPLDVEMTIRYMEKLGYSENIIRDVVDIQWLRNSIENVKPQLFSDMPSETGTLSVRGVSAFKDYIRSNLSEVQELYGSYANRGQISEAFEYTITSPEGKTASALRVPGDIDVKLTTTNEAQAVKFAENLTSVLRASGENVRVSSEHPTLIEALVDPVTGKYAHAVDIHYEGEPSPDILSPQTERAWGIKFNKPTITQDEIPTMAANEQALRKGASVLGFTENREFMMPVAHRIKDIPDFFQTTRTLLELKGGADLEQGMATLNRLSARYGVFNLSGASGEVLVPYSLSSAARSSRILSFGALSYFGNSAKTPISSRIGYASYSMPYVSPKLSSASYPSLASYPSSKASSPSFTSPKISSNYDLPKASSVTYPSPKTSSVSYPSRISSTSTSPKVTSPSVKVPSPKLGSTASPKIPSPTYPSPRIPSAYVPSPTYPSPNSPTKVYLSPKSSLSYPSPKIPSSSPSYPSSKISSPSPYPTKTSPYPMPTSPYPAPKKASSMSPFFDPEGKQKKKRTTLKGKWSKPKYPVKTYKAMLQTFGVGSKPSKTSRFNFKISKAHQRGDMFTTPKLAFPNMKLKRGKTKRKQ